jgi:hypothetical protein
MNIRKLYRRAQNILSPRQELEDEVVLKFLRILENARREELPCAEIYARLDEFVETELQGRDADKITPLIREHLEMCPECHEEYEALLSVVEHTKE